MTEAAVVGSPDPVRGEIVKAFVILAPGYKPSEKLTEELQEHVKKGYSAVQVSKGNRVCKGAAKNNLR